MPDTSWNDGRSFLLSELKSAAFPDAPHPGALVHLPPGPLPGSAADLGLLVYLHGFDNCAENVARFLPGRCVPRGELCPAAGLIEHLNSSGKNAILLVPEVRYHQKSAEPGALGSPGALRAMLQEISLRLFGPLSGLSLKDVGQVLVISHSGGYKAGISLATQGGVPTQELCLIDSLYGEEDAVVDHFVADDLSAFVSPAQGAGKRLCVLYTADGGTAPRARTLCTRLRTLLSGAGLSPDAVAQDDSDTEVTDEQFGRRLLFKRVPTDHSAMPISYVGRILSASDLPPA